MASVAVPELPVEAHDLDGLFDDEARPTFPHLDRSVRGPLAEYLERLAREHRAAPAVAVVVTLRSVPAGAAAEAEARRELAAYFAEERTVADLDVRVNRVEGMGSVRFGVPLLLVALLFAGLFYLVLPSAGGGDLLAFLTTLLYLVFITIVWVLLWDPTEMLLFDAYLLRARRSALDKLAHAEVRFVYSPPTRAAAGA